MSRVQIGGAGGRRKMSKTLMGGTVCREFKSEEPVAEEMLD